MEYENRRMSELKSLARDRGLRNYSQMSIAELVAFLTICPRISKMLPMAIPGPPIKFFILN